MKQSKYSKLRPAGKQPYRPHTSSTPEIEMRNINNCTVAKSGNKRAIVPNYLNEYDLGIFIDDIRTMGKVDLPKAKEWLTFKGYRELSDWVERYEENLGTTYETVFISFDHYLEEVDNGRFTGDDCMGMLGAYREMIGKRVDIQGHSSDAVMNDRKVEKWYDPKW